MARIPRLRSNLFTPSMTATVRDFCAKARILPREINVDIIPTDRYMRVTHRGVTMRRVLSFIVLGLTIYMMPFKTNAQQRGGGRGAAPQPPQTAKAAAAVDLTGYWVSLVTEDWRYRMFTPRKGDYQ